MLLSRSARSCFRQAALLPKKKKKKKKHMASSFRFQSTSAAVNDDVIPPMKHPPLKHIPAYPLVGSMIHQLSGIPPFDPAHSFEFWPQLTKDYGDFYTIGIPGIGEGSNGKLHILQDPYEMMKVLRSEGKFPSSVVENQWPFQKYFSGVSSMGRVMQILGHGEEWKLIRNFMQKDLLGPAAAKRYIPNIAKACKYISKGIEHRGDDMNLYLNEASFDMFWYVCNLLNE
jgi:hypothetical protein